jgi:hypothetical protein
VQVSAKLYGSNKVKNHKNLLKSAEKKGFAKGGGYGGHFRAVQGFKYIGEGEHLETN